MLYFFLIVIRTASQFLLFEYQRVAATEIRLDEWVAQLRHPVFFFFHCCFTAVFSFGVTLIVATCHSLGSGRVCITVFMRGAVELYVL